MAVKLRLTRMGAKKKPFYRIVAIDSRQPRDGKYIDLIGTYNPISQPKEVKINHEKAKAWLEKGAQPSERVKFLFEQEGILEAKPRANQAKDADPIELAVESKKDDIKPEKEEA